MTRSELVSEVLADLYQLSLVIESAVRTADPGAHGAIVALIKKANNLREHDIKAAEQARDSANG